MRPSFPYSKILSAMGYPKAPSNCPTVSAIIILGQRICNVTEPPVCRPKRLQNEWLQAQPAKLFLVIVLIDRIVNKLDIVKLRLEISHNAPAELKAKLGLLTLFLIGKTLLTGFSCKLVDSVDFFLSHCSRPRSFPRKEPLRQSFLQQPWQPLFRLSSSLPLPQCLR